jgi:hypothetical protein
VPDTRQAQGDGSASPFFYYDVPEGYDCPRFRKKRVAKSGGKDFFYSYWAGGRWVDGKPEGADPILYWLPALQEAIEAGEGVAWTEGEKDATTVIKELGMACTSHHGGAKKVYVEHGRWFGGFRGNVMLFADDDEPGWIDVRKRYDMLRAAGLSPEQLYIRLPAEGCKDVTEHFEAGYGAADLRKWSYTRLAAVTDRPEVQAKASMPYSAEDWEGLRDEEVTPRSTVSSSRGKGGKGRKPRTDNQSKILLDILRDRFPLVRDENGELYGIDSQASAHLAIPALERGGVFVVPWPLRSMRRRGPFPARMR